VGTRLIDQAVTAARAVSYHGVQFISWLAPVSGDAWLDQGSVEASFEVLHQTGQPPDGVLGLTPSLVALLCKHYTVVYTGMGSAAGRQASIVEALRPDGTVAAQFWLDKATALPLRRELFDTHAHVLSVSGFVALTLGPPASPRGAKRPVSRRPPTKRRATPKTARAPALTSQQRGAVARVVAHISSDLDLEGFTSVRFGDQTLTPRAAGSATVSGMVTLPRPWTDRLGQAQLSALRTEGWPVRAAMPGGLTLYDASESSTVTGPVVDLAYSDGLSVVSVFVQRGQLPAAMPGWRQTELSGYPLYVRNPAEPDLTWSASGYVVTVVAAAPGPVLAGVVDSMPHQARPGFWGRMGRGARRVLSWINPFR
jgi:sigma-E factor negative regulatory protein RseB